MGRASERLGTPQGEGTIPPFRPFTDLTILNSMKEMEQHMYSPGYQIFRYNNFLYLLSEYHPSDAVNFANVRNHSLLKFITRQKRAHEVLQDEKSNISTEEHYDVRIYESFLAYELYSSRVFMRQLIKQASFDHQMYNHEELVQTNISNYIRYLLNLPVNVNVNELNDVEKKHYEFKALFKRIADALYQMKKDETSDEISNEKEIKTKLLLEAITKVSYEYILLEKYNIEILNKFSDNNILEKRVLKYLFSKFHERVKVHNPESTKLLLFNTFYSVQYGWYLAVACPFVRVFETNVYAEDKDLIANKAAYEEIESKTSKRDFSQSDQMLFDTYFKKLMFSSFQEYSTMSSEKLIKLLKLIDNQSPKYSRMNRHEIPDPSSTFSHKPMNFEYYSDGLATIESNSFDMIDSPDLPLQVTVENYKTIIGEFYRILKPGGIFETKSMQFGSRSVVDFLEKHKGGGYPRSWDFDVFNLECFYDVVPQFVEAILKELNFVFGTGNVKFTVLLVCANSEVNNFLIKFSGLKLFELAGKFNDYCSMFEDQGDSSMIDKDSSVHFVVHIRARKTVPFRSFDRET
ncbi:uncharacterized protein SPAPADRAFT_144133 [Spathaspora passalidarum NRRL Y-27907]|uniref:Uncharacterized protein n=1 Tax=Spathaspora passalidarum (strain NRRL Y-27907 / 11-Y1) TaxID=619300 RepID=G3AVT7_SPAPN|nr:uncharacterized protein SPAPADRAFT_144133 [Spathaspora passalidarum NRRL Y-27907]EGW29982.1 hypothetical protein SPAPADRAFT_144133 [Spathaspora passalidarum NRRL Y-27907]